MFRILYVRLSEFECCIMCFRCCVCGMLNVELRVLNSDVVIVICVCVCVLESEVCVPYSEC